jgi:hypothetical protein
MSTATGTAIEWSEVAVSTKGGTTRLHCTRGITDGGTNLNADNTILARWGLTLANAQDAKTSHSECSRCARLLRSNKTVVPTLVRRRRVRGPERLSTWLQGDCGWPRAADSLAAPVLLPDCGGPATAITKRFEAGRRAGARSTIVWVAESDTADVTFKHKEGCSAGISGLAT